MNIETIIIIVCVVIIAKLILRRNASAPQIVVNLPADAEPLSELPEGAPIVGYRAVLWWTVYKYTCDEGGFASDARQSANAAVEKCFPNKPQ